MRVFVWLAMLTTLACAQPAGRKIVESYYEGQSLAAELKFAEGMTAHRSSDYRGQNQDGKNIDTCSDLNRFRALFAAALAVKCENKIVEFSQEGDKIVCTVKQDWEITRKLDPVPQTRVGLETRVMEDTWVRQSEDWKLSRSVLKSRSLPTWKT